MTKSQSSQPSPRTKLRQLNAEIAERERYRQAQEAEIERVVNEGNDTLRSLHHQVNDLIEDKARLLKDKARIEEDIIVLSGEREEQVVRLEEAIRLYNETAARYKSDLARFLSTS